MNETTLCPRCGAYWRCDCRFEEPRSIARHEETPAVTRRKERRSHARYDDVPQTSDAPACNHDWSETLGVDVDVDLAPEGARVFVCRHCGLYSVEAA